MATYDVRARSRLVAAVGLAVLMGIGARASAQDVDRRVTGRVIDADGKAPIPAATVRVANSTAGGATSDSGTFAFRAPSGPLTLTVRRIGYTSATVQLAADQNEVTISLARDVLKLDEEVITGVATTISSKNSANDVAVVNSEQINAVPAPTLENALQGKIAGAVIQQNNGGAPGGGMQVQIRGVTSINANAAPLYVIDGVIVNNETVNSGANAISGAANNTVIQSNQDNSANRIADINPNDIETIEVLKGASAAAIYGSKAASGVIVITTKKGNLGAPQWDVSGQAGTYVPANTLDLRTFPTYASANAWFMNDLHSSTALPMSMYTGNHNFQNELFGGGELSGQGDVSVRGATNTTSYFASLEDKYDNGIMQGTDYQKQAARTNLQQTFSSALTASVNLFYQHSVTARGITGNDNVGISPYNVFSVTPQFYNLDAISNGSWANNPFGFSNPFADAAEIQTPTTVNRFIGGTTANWKVFRAANQDLTATFTGGVDLAGQTDVDYSPPDLQVEQHKALVGTANTAQTNFTYANYSASLIHHYAGLSFLDATTSIGIAQDERQERSTNLIGQALPVGISTPTAGQVQTSADFRSDTRTLSLYAQEQILALAQRLSLTGGLTADRNSNNGSFATFYLYPHVAGSFRIPPFVGFLDEIKLRAAYGKSGTPPPYGYSYPNSASYTAVLSGGPGFVQGLLPSIPAFNINDPQLKPETSTEIETGLDLTMFKSRAQFSATVYQKQISDLILFAVPPASSGWSQEVMNGGEMTNKGIELSLEFSPVQSDRGFTWISNTTFYRNINVVNSLPIAPFVTTYGFGGIYGTNEVIPGRSVSEFVNTGIIGKDGNPVQVGDASPAALFSFSEQVSYGRVHVSGVMDYSIGGSVSNLTNAYYDLNGLYLLADSAAEAKRVTAVGKGLTPYVEDATFLKLREIKLSYDVPNGFVKAVGRGRVRSLRLDVAGRNLWSSFKYTGLDPEVSNFGSLQTARGQDVTPYPPARSIFFGVDLGI